jgi:hypothetical protein
MVQYSSAEVYVSSATTIKEKIVRINAVIDALLTSALTAAANGHVKEYSLDDGQTKISTSYNSAKDVHDSIAAFERIKQYYLNQLNGRVIRLVDSKNFTGRNYGR